MDNYKVDYHIHTICSDGEATPTEIVKRAKELEYDIISITDHDNVDGQKEAAIAGEAVGLKVVPGIEVAVLALDDVGIHMLGYDFDLENQELLDFLERIVEGRKQRNEEFLQALASIGYPLKIEDVNEGKNHYMGKPDIAKALVRKGFIENEREAYGPKILSSPECRAVQRRKPTAYEAINVILAAGGIPVMAHPIQMRRIGRPGSEEFYRNADRIIRDLKIHGLKGLECFHPDQDEEASRRFVEIAEKYHLHITRGSDFHGKDLADAEKTADYTI